MSTPRPPRSFTKQFSFLTLLAVGVILLSASLLAQTTVGTGSIVGTVSDPSGALVSGAKVTITNTQTGQTIDLSSNSAGSFNSGALPPGSYKVNVSAKGFSTTSIPVTVQVGNTSSANARLQLGQENQVVEVQGSQVSVNTEQAIVQGVVTSQQVENLPINGRNFLDLAQLEPGVQIQDGQNFDPTKAGYSSISFGGRFGRTARISVDGVDVSDETVGTTTADVPASAIDEFQLSQSSLDLSNDLTSSGAVNVTTRSGTNAFHGEAFGLFRDESFGASAPGGGSPPSQRSQFGGRFGGPIIKNKFFFFLDGERTKQDSFAALTLGDPYANFNGGFNQPFRETNGVAKADYDLGHGARAFYRYSYFDNSLAATFGLGYSVYDTKNVTRQHTLGLDFNTGTFTHSIRFSYLKFQNQIVDATTGTNLPLANLGVELSSGSFFTGPNLLAPQSTPQSNRQIKYDGTKAIHNHTIRYGVAFNHVQGGGFADFYGSAPRISWTTSGDPTDPTTTEGFAADSCDPLGAGNTPGLQPCFPGGQNNPLNYPVNRLRVGNGQGFNTLQPALGFPAGGLGPDNRLGFYVGDSWKIKPNLTINAGVRYDRDTGRTDSDLGAIPEINAEFPGYGNPVKQSNANFAPQAGFAWDMFNNGKTVLRGGIGLFYENVIWNNVLFDRPLRLTTGAFNAVTSACLGGVAQQVPVQVSPANPTGFITPAAGICGNNVAVGNVIPQILSFWQQVLAGNPLDLQAANPNYIGNFLATGQGSGGNIGLFAPDYKTPRSVQMNIGIQREIRHGMVFSADYLRNVETHSLLSIDLNQVGDVSHFDLTGAQQAIATTLANCGVATIGQAIVLCPTDPTGVGTGYVPRAATMVDFAGNGLAADSDFGQACIQALGYNCAFGGKNKNQASFFMLQPIGRSVYSALQMKLSQNVNNPMRGVKALNFIVSYSLSRFSNSGGLQLTGTPVDNDQDFVLQTADNNNPNRYFGPSLLDRTHQVSFGGYADVPGGFRIGLTSHFYSPLSSAIVSPNFGDPGEIFRTDFTGDGTVGDPLPGTHFGSFDRGTNASQLTGLINTYNSNIAGQATPAGQILIQNGLMSLADLQALGGVAPPIAAPPAGQVDFTWLKALDFKLAWRHTFKERVTVEPSVGIFNLFNFANFNLPPNTMNGLLVGESGSINGTARADNNQFRVGNGTGVYALGAPRQLEFGLRITF